ncbi:hypothetical protein BWK59_02495 [Flavobacterium davisii]|uniref:Uncharacterized protein n=1 Tax=Flavobacterium davisii TaxID=2906077 RepID=A0A246GKW2_9FLAO|nr:helix-turn-helix domain-containing protein [Flavobacterium davisii]OWP84991.1 hypothetical protein BWK59_02495 [Flavobacterium davisii]
MKINKTDDYFEFVALHRFGFTSKEISEKIGISENTLGKWLKHYKANPQDVYEELIKQNLEALHWRLRKLIIQKDIDFKETEKVLQLMKQYKEANPVSVNFEAMSKILDSLKLCDVKPKTTP